MTKICPDSCIAFGNQSTNATSYEWFFPTANPSYSTDENPINICYPTSGTYDVTLIAHNGPYSDTTVSTNLIQVYTPPSPTIVQSNDSLLVTNVTGSNTYQWFFNGTIISGATNPFYIPTQNGTYTVTVTSPETCSGSDDFVFTGVGIESQLSENAFTVYPNPANESFVIESSHQGVCEFKLYNTLGQIVSTGLVDGTFKLDVSQLPPAVYHLMLRSNNDVAAERLLIAR